MVQPRRYSDARSAERRAKRRYPICTELQYDVPGHEQVIYHGRGRTVDLSSSGLLFESPQVLPPGVRIEISIAWPATVHVSRGPSLCASARTVRCDGNRIAAEFLRHEFRWPASPLGQATPLGAEG